MKKEGRKPIKFPSKTDYHPREGYINWWENHECEDGHETIKHQIQEEIDEGVEEYNKEEE